MYKTCPYCHKIVPADHRCKIKEETRRERVNRYSRAYNHSNAYKKFIRSKQWSDMRAYVLGRDGGVDQAALNGLDVEYPYPYIETHGLQVHHIIKYEDRPDLALDPNNLITLSTRTHVQAEEGKIDPDALREIAENGALLSDR